MTNADRIRAMSNEGLSKSFLYDITTGSCPPDRFHGDYDCEDMEDCEKCWLNWLEQEVTDDA